MSSFVYRLYKTWSSKQSHRHIINKYFNGIMSLCYDLNFKPPTKTHTAKFGHYIMILGNSEILGRIGIPKGGLGIGEQVFRGISGC